ncbi:MmgE/PrpD family protein [Halomarina halobia]|uniref:MmgE/PrpD family protein n=1 Tax=Halomarina halobia TaxID=3033386 RepID=A0ABD6ADY4_9EURY|nr:MmgE/PrpD family protein [Halomarina sp. PSR21]
MSETAALAAFTADLSLTDVPEEVVERSKLAIRDFAGVALYGSQHPTGERIASYVDATAPGTGATVLGRSTASPAGAALANGTFGHAIDYDDTFESMVLHPTAPVFPTALAAAEHGDGTGEELLAGYVAGVEVAFRVGHSIYPGHYDNGWHNTGTVGTFGATAAAASVLGLDATAITRAFGIAASCSSSLKKNFGTMTKPLHPGHAAQMGIRAALLADSGFTADEAIFEDELGYGSVMNPSGEYDPSIITTDLGERWGVSDVGFKPYPSGVITHAAMEALRRLVVDADLTPENVTRVTVTLEEAASEMLIHADPRDELQAKFSIEFCLAAILRERDVGVSEFSDEYVNAPATRETMALVERAFEPDLFGGSFAGYGARVVVETADGTNHTAEEKRAPGSPSNPLPEERWAAKFSECASVVLDRQEVQRVADALARLEEPGALREFLTAARSV